MATPIRIRKGQKYGRLRILREADDSTPKHRKVVVLCECGTRKSMYLQGIATGKVVSCGCYARQRIIEQSTKHGNYGSKEYMALRAAIQRCTNPNNEHYHIYGGRGITICDRWLQSFANFIEDVGKAPSPKHSLDRRDNDGPYDKDNCRWADKETQCNNRTACVYLAHNGLSMTVAQWARHLGVHQNRLWNRIRRGWPTARVLDSAAFSPYAYQKSQ